MTDKQTIDLSNNGIESNPAIQDFDEAILKLETFSIRVVDSFGSNEVSRLFQSVINTLKINVVFCFNNIDEVKSKIDKQKDKIEGILLNTESLLTFCIENLDIHYTDLLSEAVFSGDFELIISLRIKKVGLVEIKQMLKTH